MALAHLLAPITFVIKNMNPSIVKPKPRDFKAKGNANRAIKVETRFFQLISEKEKAGFSSLVPFLKLGRVKLTIAKNPRSEAARKGRRPDPGLEKVPREAFSEETSIATPKNRKKRLLF
jgi:hypothetical protein